MKVNKRELLNQFFQNIGEREGLDPEYQRKLVKHKNSASQDPKVRDIWQVKGSEQRLTASLDKNYTKQTVSKVEKKQIRRELFKHLNNTKELPEAPEATDVSETQRRESDTQKAKEIELMQMAKIRIENKEQQVKSKEMADEIRTTAVKDARKRNKSQDNAAH